MQYFKRKKVGNLEAFCSNLESIPILAQIFSITFFRFSARLRARRIRSVRLPRCPLLRFFRPAVQTDAFIFSLSASCPFFVEPLTDFLSRKVACP